MPEADVKELVTGVVAVPRIPPFELDRPVPVVLDESEVMLLALADEAADAESDEVEVIVGTEPREVTRIVSAVVDNSWAYAPRARREISGVSVRRRMVRVGMWLGVLNSGSRGLFVFAGFWMQILYEVV